MSPPALSLWECACGLDWLKGIKLHEATSLVYQVLQGIVKSVNFLCRCPLGAYM